MAAKFFTGLPLAGPDPECVQGYGATTSTRDKPRPGSDHSRQRRGTGPVALTLSRRPCNESPV